ncbi:hypothetical protein DRQ20_04375 [bacterium]|nr:MAG: hypothetical protein DRQ18_03935 [bacterium]RKZ25806.1 MAG: hypothetical protein DRQ20_04375 [bacterium]
MKGFGTRAVHGKGEKRKSINIPVYLSSTYALTDEDYEKILEGKTREVLVYSRHSNPTRRELEEKLAMLEGAEDAVAFSSGLSAIFCTILAFVKKGEHIITTHDLYGGTLSLFKNIVSEIGIEISFVDMRDPDEVKKEIRENTKLFFFETLSNPMLKLLPLEEISEIAKEHGIKLVVDNTFLTPYNLNPLSHGADVVVHSASKYLNGHSDVIAGFSAGKKEDMELVWEKMVRTGAQLDPFSSYLVERGMRTLEIRMERHNENAMRIARMLEAHPKIRRVIYPGLESYEQFDLATRMLTRGFGGMVSFEIRGDDEDGLRFMRNLKIIKEATSLGGVESLISMPFNTSHASLTPEEREKMGMGPGFLRLSCGIENVEDLIEDLEQALSSL